MSSPSQRGRRAQRKGKQLQHLVAKMLGEVTGLGEADFTSNHGGVEGEEDIRQSEEARKRWPLRTETKNTKSLQLPAWIRKLDEDIAASGSSEPGVIIYKLHGTTRLRVDLDFEVFLDLMYGPLSSVVKRRLENMRRTTPHVKGKRKAKK